jgi:phospholipase C
MSKLKIAYSLSCLATLSLIVSGCGSSHVSTPAAVQVSVVAAGTGAGTVSSAPSGISCGQTCSASFTAGTSVTLTATPSAGSTFAGWSGACTGTGTCSLMASANASVTATFNTAAANNFQLSVQLAGTGTGSVSSSPAGITCGSTCTASFASGTAVTLSATPATGSTFAGWSGGCTGTGTCSVTLTANTSVTATFNTGSGGITSLNHIVFLAQENRSFDHYFGALREYWAQNGFADQSFDGLPQFNPATGTSPLQGPAPTNPGCNPSNPPPSDCVVDASNPVPSFHLKTVCNENTSPSWNEAHVDWNLNDQVDKYGTATLDGFVFSAAHDFRANLAAKVPPSIDVNGNTAMGYFDGGDLNYYYSMASNFATSDRWFHPVMTRTPANRDYLIAATSQGTVNPPGTNSNDSTPLTATTIFQELQAAGITWKIYVDPATPAQGGCAGPPYDPACLVGLSYVKDFAFGQTIATQYPQNIAPISQYMTDVQNGTLPQVAQIEPATDAGFDEHGSDSDTVLTNVQTGANYVSGLINTLMQSPSWKDTAFILTYDEFGGLYDHVAPQPAVSPDGIKPVDLNPGDVCNNGSTGATCDFTFTGYRVPLIVISPFTKKNYVSHTVADYTAILKLIETRFNVPALTKRDAAQMDMTEFFDFVNVPWATPPSPPAQNTNGACSVNPPPTP